MFKKSSLALAVAGFAFAGSAMAAPSVELYGRIDLGLEYYSDDDGVGAGIFAGMDAPSGNSDEQDLAMTNGNNSRLGVQGNQTLDSGMTLAYQYELKADVLGQTGASLVTRQGWLSLAKNGHTLKVGTQDNPFYDYSAWNATKSEVHGYGVYYYTTCDMIGSLSCTFRTDSTISYTYGGGGYSTDPITFTGALHFGGDARDGNTDGIKDNMSGVTGGTFGVSATFGAITVNGAYQTSVVSEGDDFNGNLSAPSIYSVGAKFAASKTAEVGFFYHMLDRDLGKNSNKTALAVGGIYQLNDKVNVHAGFGMGEDDNDAARQLDSNIFTQVTYATSDSSHVRLELEQVSYSSDTAALEGDALIALVSLRQNF